MKTDLNIRDEEILLLGLCRLSFNAEQKVMLMALAEGITDWEYFSSLANEHGVSALIYHNLQHLNFLNLLPAETTAFLKNSLMMSLGRNVRNTEFIADVLRILNGGNIKAVLLKGMALELTVYGNKGLRQMTDADILVARENCLRARDMLISNGYTSLPLKSVFYRMILADIGKHLPGLMKNGLSVDLHHELFGKGNNGLTKLLHDSSIETEVNGEKTYTPQPLIFFLYLVRHLHLHEINNESQLRLYTDLVILLENHREVILNYDLIDYAIKADMAEILAWRLEPLRDLWGITFPGWLNEFIDKWYNPASINKFIFFLKSPKENPPVNKGKVYRNAISAIPGIHRKLIFLLGDLFPTFTFMKRRYKCKSSWKALIYYPLRWGKLWYLFSR